jgi:flagellar protein FlaF
MECRLIREITGDLIGARDAGVTGIPLAPVLFRNREMWAAFGTACGARGNMLPDTLRASIVSLSLWVERYTSDVIAGRDEIEPLIDVNRQVLEGLQSFPG